MRAESQCALGFDENWVSMQAEKGWASRACIRREGTGEGEF